MKKNVLKLIKIKLKKEVEGKCLIRKKVHKYSGSKEDTTLYSIYFDSENDKDIIKGILEEEGLSYKFMHVYGQSNHYSFEFEVPVELAGEQPVTQGRTIQEMPNEVLIATFYSAIEEAERYKLKPEYEELTDRVDKVEKEILSRMLNPETVKY